MKYLDHRSRWIIYLLFSVFFVRKIYERLLVFYKCETSMILVIQSVMFVIQYDACVVNDRGFPRRENQPTMKHLHNLLEPLRNCGNIVKGLSNPLQQPKTHCPAPLMGLS